jgi:RNA polymerase sigma-70 factor, ECF subfamily
VTASGPAAKLRHSTNEPAAFVEVYEASSWPLLAYFVRRTFDVEAARDLTAESFARAFEQRSRFRGTTDAEAEGWVFGIAHNLLRRCARKGRIERKALDRLGVQMPAVGEDDYERIVDLAGLAELRGRVEAAFAHLAADQSAAVRLRVIDELSYREVAETLGVSEQTVRARVSRALRQLADALEIAPTPEVTP